MSCSKVSGFSPGRILMLVMRIIGKRFQPLALRVPPERSSPINRGIPAARSPCFTSMLLHAYRKAPPSPAFGMRVRDDNHEGNYEIPNELCWELFLLSRLPLCLVRHDIARCAAVRRVSRPPPQRHTYCRNYRRLLTCLGGLPPAKLSGAACSGQVFCGAPAAGS